MDGVGSGVEALLGELLTETDDAILEFSAGAVGDPGGGLGPRSDRLVATGSETSDEHRHPALGDPVCSGHLAAAAPLHHDRIDQVAGQLHATPPRLGVSTMARDMLVQPCPLSGGITHLLPCFRKCWSAGGTSVWR